MSEKMHAQRMTGKDWPWPPHEAYALARHCRYCGAGVGEECVWLRQRDSMFPSRFHAIRNDEASRHYSRDVGRAPWPEDRVEGSRYDTLGSLWDGAP